MIHTEISTKLKKISQQKRYNGIIKKCSMKPKAMQEKNRWNKQETYSKIFNSQIKCDRFKPNTPIITLNINGLNTPN